jgi:hypothetical protein
MKYCIQFGIKTYLTNVIVTVDEWSSVGIAINITSGVLVFHEVHETSYGQYRVIDITDAIKDYGLPVLKDSYVMLGKWQNITTRFKSSGPGDRTRTPVFICDRVLIYTRWITLHDFTDLFVTNINKVTVLKPGLSWHLTIGLVTGINFNKGTGLEIKDFIHERTGYIGVTGLYKWVAGNPPINYYSKEDMDNVNYIPGTTNDTDASNTCGKVKEELKRKCKSFENVAEFYFISCITDVLISGNLSSALDSTLAASGECMRQSQSTNNPTDELCNLFGTRGYPGIGGTNCTKKCSFGKVKNDLCLCEEGFYGVDCDKECPGGHSAPCNGHGSCDSLSGACSCEFKWSGDNVCSKCQKDWSGANCDLYNSDPDVGDIDIGNDEDHKTDVDRTNNTIPDEIDDGIGMKCKVKGKQGKIVMFNTKGKNLENPFDKAVLLELNNLRILVSCFLCLASMHISLWFDNFAVQKWFLI